MHTAIKTAKTHFIYIRIGHSTQTSYILMSLLALYNDPGIDASPTFHCKNILLGNFEESPGLDFVMKQDLDAPPQPQLAQIMGTIK